MKKHTVMIIDDDEEFVEELTEMLADAGYGTRTATTHDEALTSIGALLPDIILLDIKLKGDGIKLARKLRDGKFTCGIPIIVVSGCLDDSMVRDITDTTDIREILEKPVPPLEFITAIEKNLS